MAFVAFNVRHRVADAEDCAHGTHRQIWDIQSEQADDTEEHPADAPRILTDPKDTRIDRIHIAYTCIKLRQKWLENYLRSAMLS